MGKSVTEAIIIATAVGSLSSGIGAQQEPPAGANPKIVAIEELPQLDRFDGQLIQVTVTAQHLGNERVFSIGKEQHREVRVLVPNPSIDTAAAGDVVTVIGTVRRFERKTFAEQYPWFKETDYKPISAGDLVIVASSVRGPGGGELVPGNPVSKKAPATNP
jgi:hypothetical protein